MAKVLQVNDPRSYEEARGKKEWEQAMEEEYDALVKNKTWELVQLPKGKNVIGFKWVYKTKFKSDGAIEKFKARLVAKGFNQKEGVDYEETFAPVIKMNTVRIILSLAASLGWHIHQMDVKNAFLNGDLYEEIYMNQPPGFVDQQHPNLVCRLKKSLYGLKQAPRAWNEKIDRYFQLHGFQKCKSDPNLYVKRVQNEIILFLQFMWMIYS